MDEALIEIYLNNPINRCLEVYQNKKKDFIKTNLGVINDYIVSLSAYLKSK
jgi:hypothetical protein